MKISRRALCVAALAALPSAALAQQVMGIGTNPQGTLLYTAGTGVAKVMIEKAGLRAVVQPASGTSAIVPQIDTGQMEFGIVNAVETAQAIRGEGGFAGKPQPNLRAVAVLFPVEVGISVPAKSEIRAWADVKGKPFPWAYSGQTVVDVLQRAIFANVGLKPEDVRHVPVPNVIRALDDFAAGNMCCTFQTVANPRMQEIGIRIGGVRYLPLDKSAEAEKRMQAIAPGSYVIDVQPGPVHTGIDKPTAVMGYNLLLIAGKHVPDEIVAKTVKALAESKDALVAMHGAFARFERAAMGRQAQIAFHPGAESFYKAAGIAVGQ